MLSGSLTISTTRFLALKLGYVSCSNSMWVRLMERTVAYKQGHMIACWVRHSLKPMAHDDDWPLTIQTLSLRA